MTAFPLNERFIYLIIQVGRGAVKRLRGDFPILSEQQPLRFPRIGISGSPLSENTPLLGSSVHRGNLLLPQHVGSRLTKSLPSASTPC